MLNNSLFGCLKIFLKNLRCQNLLVLADSEYYYFGEVHVLYWLSGRQKGAATSVSDPDWIRIQGSSGSETLAATAILHNSVPACVGM